jgi:hypothetical protein
MAKKTFIVGHPNQYLKVDGKLARVKKGTEVTMEEKHAASLVKQGKLLVKGQNKAVDVGGETKPEEKE